MYGISSWQYWLTFYVFILISVRTVASDGDKKGYLLYDVMVFELSYTCRKYKNKVNMNAWLNNLKAIKPKQTL